MKKLYLVIYLFIFSLSIAVSQPAVTIGGSGLNDEPLDILKVTDGSLYSIGYYNQIAQFGSFVLNFTGADDAFITKSSPNGSYIWATNISGVGPDRATCVAETNDGNIIVAGFYTNSATLGSLTIGNSGQNVFVAKINSSNGSPIWFRSYGGSATENLTGLSVLSDGSIVIAGQYNGSTQFGAFTSVSEEFYQSGTQGYDVYVAKLNSEGVVNNCAFLSSSDNDFVSKMRGDENDNVYIAMQGAVELNVSTGGLIDLNNAYSGVLVKLNENLNLSFGRTFNASYIDLRAIDIKGNFVSVVGNYQGTLVSNTPGISPFSSEYANGIFGINLDTSGTFISYFEESSDNDLSVNAVSINNHNKLWIGGKFRCTLNSLADHYGDSFFNNIRFDDVFVAYFGTSTNNDLSFAQHLGSKGQDNLTAIDCGNEALPTLAGSFTGRLFQHVVANCSTCGNTVSDYPSTICNIPNFQTTTYRDGIGSKDVFISTVIDTTSSILNIYRSPNCNFDIREPAINITSDTLFTCENLYINVIHNINVAFSPSTGGNSNSDNYYIYEWRRNGLFVSSQNQIYVSLPGQYVLKIRTQDNCKVYFDTLQVVFLQGIETPELTVAGTTIYPTVNSIGFCDNQIPKHIDSTITVTGQFLNPSDTLTWYNTIPNPDLVIAEGTPSIEISSQGSYGYEINTIGGCSGFNCFNVWDYYFYNFPGVGGLPLGNGQGINIVNPILVLGFDDLLNDTVLVCGQNGGIVNVEASLQIASADSSIFGNLPTIQFGYWDITGPSVMYPFPNADSPVHSFLNHTMNIRVNASGWVNVKLSLLMPWQNVDTLITIESNVYVIYTQKITPVISFESSTNDLCPGDTMLVSYTVDPVFPYSANAFNGSAVAGQTDTYQFLFPGTLNVNVSGTDEFGCPVTNSRSFEVEYKEAPSVIANPVNARKCPEDSVILNAVSGQSVEWIGPEGTPVGNDFQIQVVPPGGYYYNLIDNDGCSLLSSTIEVRNIQAVIYDSIITTNICGGNPALVLLAPDTNLQYQWLYPMAGSDTIRYISQPGNYSVSVALCSNIDTLNFTIFEGLASTELAISAGPQYLCDGKTIELESNPIANNTLWLPGNQTTQSISVNDEGMYKVVVSDTFGCVLADSIFIQQFPNPAIPDTIITPNACPGTPITMEVNSNFTFYWHAMPDSTFLDSGNQYTTEIQNNGQQFGGYLNNEITGCRSEWVTTSATLLEVVNIAPFPAEIIYCPGDTVTFEPADAIGIAGGYWIGPNQFSLSQEDLIIQGITLQQEGNYTYAAISAAGYCTYDTAVVNLQPRFLEPTEVVFSDSLCRNETIQFSANEIANYNYVWNGPMGISSNNSDWTIPVSTMNNSGTYYLTANQGNCIRVDSFAVFVSEIPPQTPLITAPTHICHGDTLFLFNADSANTSNTVVNWSGSDLFQYSSANAVFIPDFQSSYTTSFALQYGINFCLSEISTTNPQFQELPVFAFEDDSVEFCLDAPIQINSPSESTFYTWTTGSAQSSTIVYETTNLFLTLTDVYGCRYIDSISVIGRDCDLNDTPNTFSPNGDNVNDELAFTVEGGKVYEASIFTRWGLLVKKIGPEESTWDGTDQNGEPVTDGTYYYTLKVQMVNSEWKNLEGFITIFR